MVVARVVLVAMDQAAMLVEVLVDEVGAEQELPVAQDLLRRAVGQDPPLLAEDDDALAMIGTMSSSWVAVIIVLPGRPEAAG